MENKFMSLYLILGGCALVLILTGLLLPTVLNLLNIDISSKVLYMFQSAFIISGLLDAWLVFYAKKKLSE
ncbi:MAG: hypothetical protein K6A44_03295 [bacterium]|nr:hypothetical protein [bacterium]